jgi:cell division protein FtsZ
MIGARGVLINITGGYDMTLFEVDEAANRIRDEVDPDANIIFGSTFNESMEGKMRVSVVATGIDQAAQFQKPISHDNSSDNPRNYSTRISGGSQTKDDGSSARNNLTFGKPETSTEAKKESAAPLAASMATRPVEPRPEARASAPAQPVRQSQGLRQLRPSLQPQENEASRPAQQEITDQMAADILEESRADLQGALFDETAEEVIAASAGGPRGSIRTAPSPAQRSAAPSGMQQLRNDHPQNPAEEDHEHHSGFFSRVTSRFAPAAEEQQPRRVEVKTSRTVVPDDEDYLEIPAFLRRQAN